MSTRRLRPSQRGPEADPVPTAAFLVAYLAGARYALPLADVVEVGRQPAVTRVPNLPPFCAGVANWRGRLLAVLDLAAQLGGTPPSAQRVGETGSGRLVVLASGGVSVGVLADGLDGLLEVPRDTVTGLPETAPVRTPALLTGQVPSQRGPVALLDVPAVVGLRDLLPRARAAADPRAR